MNRQQVLDMELGVLQILQSQTCEFTLVNGPSTVRVQIRSVQDGQGLRDLIWLDGQLEGVRGQAARRYRRMVEQAYARAHRAAQDIASGALNTTPGPAPHSINRTQPAHGWAYWAAVGLLVGLTLLLGMRVGLRLRGL